MSAGANSVAEIDLEAVRANAAQARRLAAGRAVIAVVKADAYGHGAVPVARTLLEAGCARLAVLTLAEASELREAAIAAPILLMGAVRDRDEAERALALDLTPVLHHSESLELVAEAAKRSAARVPVHVEVDTGMRRMGVAADAAHSFLRAVERAEMLELEGVFTHFARADEVDLRPSLEQLALFRRVLDEARSSGIAPAVVHVSNSAGLLAGEVLAGALPEATAVRPGLMLYGVRPAPHAGREVELRPAMALRACVCHVRDLAPGDSVGYGASFRTDRASRVATLPLGYADGIPWSLGNRGSVWLRGARRPIVGRISMDYVSVEVSNASVGVGDEAVFFGGQGLPVEELAEAAGTLPYELLVRVGRRVPRRFDTATAPR